MNKTILIFLVFIFVLSFGLTYSVNAADFFKEWKCGSGLSCGSSCQGVSYKPIGGANDPEFTFSAEPGIYNCEVSVKNNWFAFTGDTPELNEYSDVYLNDVWIGYTNDLFCNSVTPNGNGNGGGQCRDGELDVIDKEIYTRAPVNNPSNPCGHHYGYCSTSPGIPRGCCSCREFTVQSHYLEDNKWARIRVSGGARCCKGSCCKNKAGKIFLATSPCSAPSNGLCQMPSSTICSLQGHRGASTCCDLSGYIGQTIHACACNTERAMGCDNPDEGQHPVAIAVCGYGTNMETCSDGNGNGNGDCDNDGDCESGETHANCPSDCECDTIADCQPGERCVNHNCVEAEEHMKCVGRICKSVPGSGPDECDDNSDCSLRAAGESEMETESVYFSFEFVYIILILMVGFLVAWELLIRKNLTYLYELFKMNARKFVLILAIAFVFSISLHFSPVNAADLFEEWKCGSGLNCGSDCQGAYKPLNNNNYEFSFPAEEGIYNCDVNTKSCCFGFTGDTPELNEYSDVYLNDFPIGHTDDLFCNEVIPDGNGNGNGGRCDGAKASCADKTHVDGDESASEGYCDDQPFRLYDNEAIEMDVSECGCGGGYAFVKRDAQHPTHLPRCQTWVFDEEGNVDVSTIGGEIVWKLDCPTTKNIVTISGLGDGRYTVGSWAPRCTGGASLVTWCPVPESGCTSHAECGSGKVCCDGECYTGECCTSSDCSSGYTCVNHNCEGGNGPNGPNGCFPAGTRIRMADGSLKDIKDIEPGDRVLSFEDDNVVVGTVTGLYPSESDHYYILKIENHEVRVTKQHRFYVGNGEFKRVHDLSVGDEVYILEDGELVLEKIIYKELVKESVKVYNFNVDGIHTYIANGFAVHNLKPPEPPEYAGESEIEIEDVYFGLTFNRFGGNDESKTGVEGTKLSFASGCEHCGDVIKTIPVTGVQLGASNKIKLQAYQSHGLRSISITCTQLKPPVADAGPDQTVNLTGPYVTVIFNGLGSYDEDGYIVDYRWNFSDGYFGYGVQPTHNYYEEGIYNVTLNVTDNDVLKGSDYMILTVADTPTITDDYAYDGVWVNTDQTVTLTAQDSSGIDRVMYCYGVDCDPANGWTLSGPPYTLSFAEDMNRWVMYKAWDIYDNPSETGEFNVKIDKTAPVTTDDSDTEIHGNNYAITLTCTDGAGSGCDKTYYCVSLNGSSTCSPTSAGTNVYVTCGSFDYCEKVIRYYSVDKVDNTESTKTSNVIRIDTRIPTCDMGELEPYTTTTSISLTWSGEDPGGSGVTGYRIYYRKDSGSWNIWDDFSGSVESGAFAGEDGSSYDFRCQAKTAIYPNGGSYSTTVSTFVDTTSPDASMDTMPEWANQESFSVSWSGDDSGSGVKDYDVQYSTSPPTWNNWLSDTDLTSEYFGEGSPIDINDGTTYHFRVRARDNAGLVGAWSSSESIGVDLTPPTCSIDDLPDYITTSQLTVSWSGDDSGSGVKDYDVDYSSDDENWVSFESQTTDESKTETLMDGEYYFRCRSRDVADNVGDWSGSEGVSVDTRAPGATVDYESPVLVGKNITVNATLYDVSNITNVTLIYGDTVITEFERIETYANRWNVSWTFPVTEEYGPDQFFVVTEDIHGNSKSERYSFNTVLCEEEEVRGCGTDIGECIKGSQTCVAGVWGECLGGLGKRLEVCDGKDNDCNGLVDDGIQCSCVPGTTRDCGIDTGECKIGTQSCTSNQIWGPCGGNYAGPEPEVCDGKDNNCNGLIDDGANCCPEGKKRPCGFSSIGICELGLSMCMGGIWGSCIGSVMPEQHDICDNGLDDDCDGEIDEGCALCSNNEQDEDEEGIDCGGPCPPCPEFPWFILSIIGVIILVVLFIVWRWFKSKGEELSWEALKGRWSG